MRILQRREIRVRAENAYPRAIGTIGTILQRREIRVRAENAYPRAIGTIGTISPWNTLWSSRTINTLRAYTTSSAHCTCRAGNTLATLRPSRTCGAGGSCRSGVTLRTLRTRCSALCSKQGIRNTQQFSGPHVRVIRSSIGIDTHLDVLVTGTPRNDTHGARYGRATTDLHGVKANAIGGGRMPLHILRRGAVQDADLQAKCLVLQGRSDARPCDALIVELRRSLRLQAHGHAQGTR